MDDELDEYPHGDDDHLDNDDGYAHDNGDDDNDESTLSGDGDGDGESIPHEDY